MIEILSGTGAHVEAAAAFLQDNGFSSGPLRESNAGTPGALFAVASCRGRIVGLARGSQARKALGAGAVLPGKFHINTVLVDPMFRGAGVGQGLVERLLADAGARGFTTAQLWVEVGNAAARSLYAKFGFRPSGAAVDDESRGPIQPMCADL